ncbi:MAG: phosphoenolpyruvate carboxykinase (ATP) [Planctomycetota bacterium]
MKGRLATCPLFLRIVGYGETTCPPIPAPVIGDDEHCWSDEGVFNIEGGCYAKCIDLSEQREPEIFHAIRFGAILENVVYDPLSRVVDYRDSSITENTRCAYPIEYIPNAKIPCVAGHPSNVVFLTCDAFGVLPPVSKLNPAQAMYHFLSGYTAKVAGTEMGVREPQATFSTCFGAPFLVWHPTKYGEMLAEKIRKHGSNAWLVNTGWSGGMHGGGGARMPLPHTRAIIDAIHSGALDAAPTVKDPIFGFEVPTQCPNVPDKILIPRLAWEDPNAYDRTAKKLAQLFCENFERYSNHATAEVLAAGPSR